MTRWVGVETKNTPGPFWVGLIPIWRNTLPTVGCQREFALGNPDAWKPRCAGSHWAFPSLFLYGSYRNAKASPPYTVQPCHQTWPLLHAEVVGLQSPGAPRCLGHGRNFEQKICRFSFWGLLETPGVENQPVNLTTRASKVGFAFEDILKSEAKQTPLSGMFQEPAGPKNPANCSHSALFCPSAA